MFYKNVINKKRFYFNTTKLNKINSPKNILVKSKILTKYNKNYI